MTSRINRDRLVEKGSTKTAVEGPDFLTTTDPWFRPVDLQIGPDGALYVADFYNRIIGHYEVPLSHPGRDRERARIWRITYTGKPMHGLRDLTAMNSRELISEFRNPNITRRMLAMNELLDRAQKPDVSELNQVLERSDASAPEIVHTLWTLARMRALEPERLRKLARHQEREVRVHVMRILAEDASLGSVRQPLALQALRDVDGLVQRQAAEAIGRNPEQEVYVRPLLTVLERAPAEDPQLRHAVRMALRDQLAEGGPALSYRRYKSDPETTRVIADICLAIPNQDSAGFLLEYIQNEKQAGTSTAEYVRHCARYTGPDGAEQLAGYVQSAFKNDVDQQLVFFKAIQEGSAQRGSPLGDSTLRWGTELASSLLNISAAASQPWWNIPHSDAKVATNPWFLQKRESDDGDKEAVFMCSLPPGGESLTGILRSQPFEVPRKLTFYLAGHDGMPDKAGQGKNFIRLVVANSGKTVARASAPRHDIARKIEWDLSEFTPGRAYLELVDGDNGPSYAWIAAGRFNPEVVPLPKIDPKQLSARVQSAAEIAKTFKIASLAPDISSLLRSQSIDDEARAALGGALAVVEPNSERTMLAPLLADGSVPAELRREIGSALAEKSEGAGLAVVANAMRSAPNRIQLRLAQNLAGNAAGVDSLLTMVEKGEAAPRLLLDQTIQTKIKAGSLARVQERLAKLTSDLEPASEVAQKQIDHFRTSYDPAKASPAQGARVFTQNCAVCHQIDGSGAVVGPQLDGIGSRGVERILEDILDPNRNIDVNFRSHAVITKEGDVVTGVVRRQEGELLVLADSTGKEISIPKKEIDSRRESAVSIMPANFGEVIFEKDFHDLLAFLLSKGASQGK